MNRRTPQAGIAVWVFWNLHILKSGFSKFTYHAGIIWNLADVCAGLLFFLWTCFAGVDEASGCTYAILLLIQMWTSQHGLCMGVSKDMT